MFSKAKCWLCEKKDFRHNMNSIAYGIYIGCLKYFHDSCVKTIVCEPEAHGHQAVDRALWVGECLISRAAAKRSTEEVRKKRLLKMQAVLCKNDQK